MLLSLGSGSRASDVCADLFSVTHPGRILRQKTERHRQPSFHRLLRPLSPRPGGGASPVLIFSFVCPLTLTVGPPQSSDGGTGADAKCFCTRYFLILLPEAHTAAAVCIANLSVQNLQHAKYYSPLELCLTSVPQNNSGYYTPLTSAPHTLSAPISPEKCVSCDRGLWTPAQVAIGARTNLIFMACPRRVSRCSEVFVFAKLVRFGT